MIEFKDIKPEYIRLREDEFNLIRELAHGTYVEVGTFHGGSAVAASRNATQVYTLDIYDWLPLLFSTLPNVHPLKSTASDFSRDVNYGVEKRFEIDTLFIDGSHEYDYVKKDIEALVPLVKTGGLIMFHDYTPWTESQVTRAVNEYIEKYKPEIVREPIEGKNHIIVLRK